MTDRDPRHRPGAELVRLSPREVEVWDLVAQGRTLQEIARDMGITYKTAKNYTSALREKLGVATLTCAAILWWQQQLAAFARRSLSIAGQAIALADSDEASAPIAGVAAVESDLARRRQFELRRLHRKR